MDILTYPCVPSWHGGGLQEKIIHGYLYDTLINVYDEITSLMTKRNNIVIFENTSSVSFRRHHRGNRQ